MRHDVEWDEAALEELADVWMRSADPSAVRDAANRVDRELSWAPDRKGVDFYGDRMLIVPPLQVVYKVDAAARTVTVLHIW